MICVSGRNPCFITSHVSGFRVDDSGLFIPSADCWISSPIFPPSFILSRLTPTQLHHLTPTSFYLYTRFLISASTNSSSSFVTAPSSFFGDDESYGPIPPRDMGVFGEVPISGPGLFPCGPVCPTIPEVGEYLVAGPDVCIGPLLPECNHNG